ncbi:MAG TPA: hypothetical protein VNF68_02375 [Candidatus Baltobacteraceae bacterium]|nr:hypothetical protein [Candidatus Baltobacteraceae bacterium]
MRRRLHNLASLGCYCICMNHDRDKTDVPLPGTLGFVLVMALGFLAGWIGLFLLLKERW